MRGRLNRSIRLTEHLVDELIDFVDNLSCLEKVVEAAKKTSPGVSVAHFSEHVAHSAGLEFPAVDAILSALWNFRRGVYALDQSPEEVIDSLSEELNRTKRFPEWDIGYRARWQEALPRIKTAIAQIDEDDPLMLSAKALAITYDRDRLLRSTRLFADIRPVFNGAGDKVHEMVVTFTLAVDYSENDNRSGRIDLALDKADVISLMKQCERALSKAKTIVDSMPSECGRTVVFPDMDEL